MASRVPPVPLEHRDVTAGFRLAAPDLRGDNESDKPEGDVEPRVA